MATSPRSRESRREGHVLQQVCSTTWSQGETQRVRSLPGISAGDFPGICIPAQNISLAHQQIRRVMMNPVPLRCIVRKAQGRLVISRPPADEGAQYHLLSVLYHPRWIAALSPQTWNPGSQPWPLMHRPVCWREPKTAGPERIEGWPGCGLTQLLMNAEWLQGHWLMSRDLFSPD